MNNGRPFFSTCHPLHGKNLVPLRALRRRWTGQTIPFEVHGFLGVPKSSRNFLRAWHSLGLMASNAVLHASLIHARVVTPHCSLALVQVAVAQMVPALLGIGNEKSPSRLLSAVHLACTALLAELQSLALPKAPSRKLVVALHSLG